MRGSRLRLSRSERRVRGKLALLYAAAIFGPFCVFLTAELALGVFEWGETLLLFIASLAALAACYAGMGWLVAGHDPMAMAVETPEMVPLPALEKCDGHNLVASLIARVNRRSTVRSRPFSVEENPAHRDPLTGLWNRTGFEEAVTTVTQWHSTNAIALIDLDHFRKINDRYGSSIGDDTLRFFANRLIGAFRRDELIARWEGEMFVVLLAGATLHEGTLTLQRLRNALHSEPLVVAGRQAVHFSAGVALITNDDTYSALRVAGDALDQAKRAGRDRVEPALRGLG